MMMKKIFVLFVLALLSAACVENTGIPEADLRLEGRWAEDNGFGMTSMYMEFRFGNCFIYESTSDHYVFNGKIWGCGAKDFELVNSSSYEIDSENFLSLDGINKSRFAFQSNGTLMYGDKIYIPFYELTEALPELSSLSGVSMFYEGSPVRERGADFVVSLDRYCTCCFTAAVTPSDARSSDLVWLSDRPDIVSVDENGTVTANRNGEALITVFSKENPSVKDCCKVSVSTDAAREGKANCYIADSEGHYHFDAGEFPEIVSAGVLWSMDGYAGAEISGLVNNVSYDYRTKEISFDVKYAREKTGNVLIAGFDDKGAVVWSWHIWVYDGLNLDWCCSMLTLSSGEVLIMELNLGAFGQSYSEGNASFGLMYQWGRKDPFPCAAGSYDSKLVGTAVATGFEWETVECDWINGSPDYAARNPMTFIKSAQTSGDWLWNKKTGDSDFMRWSSSDRLKNDPCPAGWHIAGIEALTLLESMPSAPCGRLTSGLDMVYDLGVAAFLQSDVYAPASSSSARRAGCQFTLNGDNVTSVKSDNMLYYACPVRCIKNK